jgi:UDP-2,3-diacylglucosamine pyrophosphatase LpxH
MTQTLAPEALRTALEEPPFENFPEAESAGEDGSRRYRSIFISDLHLGTRGCKADFLLDFLRHNESQYLYLVGDIIDGWELRKSWSWPQQHNDILQKILRKARKGTRVVYIPGNHDEFARSYTRMHFGGVEVVYETAHETADGKRFLVLHGDKFDGIVKQSKWLAHLGSTAYNFTLSLNHYFNLVRRRLGYSYWSLSAYLKHKVKNAVGFIYHYEHVVVQEARRRGMDGIICGHIHKAEMKTIDGILYCNDGDWVESCTALVEHFDGRLELVHWAEVRDESPEAVLTA